MFVNMIDILNDAKNNKYSIAHFNINNLEWTRFILEECNKLNVPVILGVSESTIKYMGGYKTVVNLVRNLVKYLDVTIPVSIHLDHGSSYESCKLAIDSGFTSVMIDASKYALEDNIKITKEVVLYAHSNNVSVEAEIGHVGINNNGTIENIMYANLDDCIRFVKETKIDFLAPAVGCVHGPYVGEADINIDLIRNISEKCNIPLVLHGGSGISPKIIKESIDNGICKININTELQQVWSNEVRNFLNENKTIYDPRKIIKSGELALKKMIDFKIDLFNNR